MGINYKKMSNKANIKQINVCNLITTHCKYWIRTNDLSSPTHGGDLSEDLKSLLENDLTDAEIKELEIKLNDLLNFIRKV